MKKKTADAIVGVCTEAKRRYVLYAATDAILAHKPKPKSKPARKRARRAKKIAQAADV